MLKVNRFPAHTFTAYSYFSKVNSQEMPLFTLPI
jgi:hypothetical protein